MLISNPLNIYINKKNLYISTRDNIFIINSNGKIENIISNLKDLIEHKTIFDLKNITFLGDILYFIDKSILFHLEDNIIIKDIKLTNPKAIVSGKGSCGNFRVFIIDENKLKNFDPISNTIQILLNLNNPTSITKFECNLYIIDENKILNFNLKNFTLIEIKIHK